jgi:ABC-type polysaccharide/polyol phosphate transport system ATPase subunit
MAGADPALRFSHVTKTFPRHTAPKLLRERLADLLRPAQNTRFTALDDVSFEVAHGESLGLIGANGAGKSTILNLATGLALPESGSIQVQGRVAAILELGAGFHGDLTGAENLRINAALMGLSRRQTAKRVEEIVEFSGVRDFINEPLRTYSAGMSVRLAFAVAVHTDPDVLVIDEVIGLGDQEFYARCLEKIRAFQSEGKTILLASHALDLLTMLCQRALWLDHGRVIEIGPAEQVAAAYRARRATGA